MIIAILIIVISVSMHLFFGLQRSMRSFVRFAFIHLFDYSVLFASSLIMSIVLLFIFSIHPTA